MRSSGVILALGLFILVTCDDKLPYEKCQKPDGKCVAGSLKEQQFCCDSKEQRKVAKAFGG